MAGEIVEFEEGTIGASYVKK